MICPNISIKEVKDGFNEMVEALGGRPLTDEEFKSSELRNQRTGQDYSAMEAAYRSYHRNNGNMLDKAPNGNDSVLFNSLLEHFGNRAEAIKAKANVYTDEFFNWFGDWTAENKEDVSKVIDENGEPLIVYHGGARNIEIFNLPNSNSGLIDFTTSHNIEWAVGEGYEISDEMRNKYNKEGYIKNATKPVGIYFAKDEVVSRSYFGRRNEEDDALYYVFLDIKNPYKTDKDGL